MTCAFRHPHYLGGSSSIFFIFVVFVARILRAGFDIVFERDAEGRLYDAKVRARLCCCRLPACFFTFVDFRMRDVSKDRDGSLWERYSVLFGRPQDSYWLERVLDADGRRTAYMAHVVEEVQERCLALPPPGARRTRSR